jgi:chlorite dismutase
METKIQTKFRPGSDPLPPQATVPAGLAGAGGGEEVEHGSEARNETQTKFRAERGSEVLNGQVDVPAHFFTRFAAATNPYRQFIRPQSILWGFTQPSQYTKTRSAQEIDPFDSPRAPYLIVYPFVKTVSWYLMSREARQGMMNEHIRIGKQYPEIKQLLLYSFGLQDQEFIVVYETADLSQFSNLVYELRSSEARRYTERDTPLFTAIYHPAEETLDLWA